MVEVEHIFEKGRGVYYNQARKLAYRFGREVSRFYNVNEEIAKIMHKPNFHRIIELKVHTIPGYDETSVTLFAGSSTSK